MDSWLKAALAYVPRWLEYQMQHTDQPGCVVALAHRGRLVYEEAFGKADLGRGTALTPRHVFRVASHSKSFTAAGILKLRDQGRLGLDDRVGRYVAGLHPAVARATIGQLLCHSAGVIRDGADAEQWTDRRPFLSAAELRADLAGAPVLAAGSRFKYSNHGFGLLGLAIESIGGEAYATWIKREIVDAAGLEETWPDLPLRRGILLARGHSGRMPLGHRVVIPGDNPTRAMAPATGFVSTAADLVRFYSQLDPEAKGGLLSAASRREMIRPHWRVPHTAGERQYGLGISIGLAAGWESYGHGGGFQGTLTRTGVLPQRQVCLSVLTNAIDGAAPAWFEGVVHILRTFADGGAPARRVRDWTGRWWGLWGPVDLVPVGDRVLVADPEAGNAFLDASQIEVEGRDQGRIALAGGFNSHGEGVSRRRDPRGRVVAVDLAGIRLLPEKRWAQELQRRYGRR